jgi:DNA ligase-1
MRKFFEDNSELHSVILDSEVVAFDPDNGELRSFQELSARPRKDVRVEDIKVPICVFAFDVMYLNAKVKDFDPCCERSVRTSGG